MYSLDFISDMFDSNISSYLIKRIEKRVKTCADKYIEENGYIRIKELTDLPDYNFLKNPIESYVTSHKEYIAIIERLKDRINDYIIQKKQENLPKEQEILLRELEKQKEKKSLENLVSPIIKKIVKLHIDETVRFPKILSIKDTPLLDATYKKALQEIIKNQHNIEIESDFLHSLIFNEYKIQVITIFKKSFLELNPNIKNSKILQDWMYANIDTFGNSDDQNIEFTEMLKDEEISILSNYNDEQIQVLREMAEKAGLIFEYFIIMLLKIETIDKLSISKLAENISDKMEKNEKLFIKNNITINDINKMTGLEFERFLCELFSKNGYKAEITKASGDQGADLIIEKLGERTVIQAKRYSSAVSNSAIQEVVAAKAHYNCYKAMVVTNSYFTKSAMELALSNNVELVDREKLEEKLKDYNLNNF